MTSSEGSSVRQGCALVGRLAALFAAVYLVARAVRVPLTYDEATSFFRHVVAEPAALFDFASAANHFLNSMLTRLSHAAFGGAPWALRLPNVLAGFGYLACATALAGRMRHPVIGLAGLLLLVTNPYLLEYLALSRGYGLAIALLTGSVFVLLRWCDCPLASSAAKTDLAVSLGLAGLAVAANYAVLPAFLALVTVAVVRLAWVNRHAPATAVSNGRATSWSWRHVAIWLLITAAFSTMVFSRERVLSRSVYLPITVRVAGLFEEELATIRVFRSDVTGRLRELARQPGGLWRTGPVDDAWELRVAMPAAIDRNLASLDVTMGAALFRRDRRAPGPWTVADSGTDRVLVATDAMKWQGNAAHRRLIVVHTVALLGALAALGGGLIVLSRAMVRARLIGPEHARIVVAAVLGVASAAAAPLYLLQRDGQLFFGGTSGLVRDTFGSLVIGTAYGAEYHPAQVRLALIAFGVAAAGLPFALLVSSRARRDVGFRAPAAVLAVLALAAAQAELQHHVLGTPYPTARTALFLLPLLLLFIALFADALAALGRATRVIVTTAMLLVAAGGVWHVVRVANLSRTLDWPHDSSTATLLRRVERAVVEDGMAPAVVRIGVEWLFYPVARYYAECQSSGVTRYDVSVLPGDGRPFDFVYATPAVDEGQGGVVLPLAESDAVLRRMRR